MPYLFICNGMLKHLVWLTKSLIPYHLRGYTYGASQSNFLSHNYLKWTPKKVLSNYLYWGLKIKWEQNTHSTLCVYKDRKLFATKFWSEISTLLKLICSRLGSWWHFSSIISKLWMRLGILFLKSFSSCWEPLPIPYNLSMRKVVFVSFSSWKKKLFPNIHMLKLFSCRTSTSWPSY